MNLSRNLSLRIVPSALSSRFSRFGKAAALTAAISALAWGCGSGGGSGSSLNPLNDGRSALNRLAAGEQPANEQSLQTILDLFLQAIQQDPNSSEAHFGAAVCLAGQIGQEVDGTVSGGDEGLPPAAPPQAGGPGGAPAPMPPAPPRHAVPGTVPSNAGPSGEIGPNEVGDIPPAPIGASGSGTASPGKPMMAHRALGLIWNLDNGLSNPYTLLHMLAPISDLRAGLAPYWGYSTDDVARRQKMLDGLNTVAEHLAKVEADPNFSITLPNRDENAEPVTVGLPEVYLFDAYVQSLRAEISMSLAYIRDPGTSWSPPLPPQMLDGANGGGTAGVLGVGVSIGIDPVAPYWMPSTMDKNKDGKLTPDEYLPPSPYLTLRDAKFLKTSQDAMLAVVDRETKGIDGVLARPADGKFLVPNRPRIAQLLGEVKAKVLPLIQQAATGPVTFEVPRYDIIPLAELDPAKLMAQPASASRAAAARVTRHAVFEPRPLPIDSAGNPVTMPDFLPMEPRMEKVTINISAWFATPPADLKTLAPTLTLSAEGWPQYDKTVYPDPTFAGLFPNGIKDELPF